MTTLIQSLWTGTRALQVVGDGLPDDPEDALAELNRRHETHVAAQKRTTITPKLVALAWEWATEEFERSADLEERTVGQLVQLYLDS